MTRAAGAQISALRQLAHLYGVQTAYYDVVHRRRQASPDALLLTLQALGAPLESFRDAPAALRERRQALWTRFVEPVLVAWDGEPAEIEIRLPVDQTADSVAYELTLESGDVKTGAFDMTRLAPRQTADVEGVRYVAMRPTLPHVLPWGYHRLVLERSGGLFETMIISAPVGAHVLHKDSARGIWGVFLPLYALHSAQSWGGGDLADLEALVEWIAGHGGNLVATLPLLAAFLDEPCDPSPYAPASRLFWNEFYLDLGRIPELETCPAAKSLLESKDVHHECEVLRSSPLVNYRRQMALKRKVLEELAHCLSVGNTEGQAAFQRFVEGHPEVEDYACFRATGERQQAAWPSWPEPLRDGVVKEGDFDEAARRYHLYVQWVAHDQIKSLSEKGKAAGVGLYFDLPLGVHPYSYDVWRYRKAFVLSVSGGAPPDTFFSKGQNWGFPPLHPEAIRKQSYRYYIAYLRHQLKHTSLLRIDHVMGLHRLFWIPDGLESRNGVYVRYPAEEFYAILSLESHRHQCCIVGENLGTVPTYVNLAMARHNFHRMYVMQYELAPGTRRILPTFSRNSVASLNTHDMPPFAAFWEGLDIDQRLELGLLDETDARTEGKNRHALRHALERFLQRQGYLKTDSASLQELLRACLTFLSVSPAPVVVVNLEDLWLETQPQNLPGTGEERPNWQRKARYSLEVFSEMPLVLETFQDIKDLRKRGKCV